MSGEPEYDLETVSVESESDDETKSGGTASKVTKTTCVFWDVDECPIPNGVDINLIYQNIKSALANYNEYDGGLEMKLYGEKKPFSDDLMLDTGITFVTKGIDAELRSEDMLFGMLSWALIHRPSKRRSYQVMVISHDVIGDPLLIDTLDCLNEEAYDVLLAQPDEVARKLEPEPKVLPFEVKSVWIWTTLIAGGCPIIGKG